MSLIKKELTEKSGFEIEFSVSKELYEKAEYEAYRKNVKSINIPGFRKGKAPKAIIEKYYGKDIWFEDAINACIPEAFEEAVKEAGLDIVGQPQFDLVSNDGDIVLKAVGFVKPEATIDGYKGIAVEKKVDAVSDADVDAEVENARKRNARTIDVADRAATMGDIANINYEGFVDGVAFNGGKGENHDLTLGSGAFIPGFEEQIVGKAIGEEFEVNVTFPEEYHAAELAGKAATFKVTVKAITKIELPELDDDFAKDVSEFDTFAEYRADIEAKILKRHENAAESIFEETIVKALNEKLAGEEIPEAMFEAEAENLLRDYDNRLRMQGLDLNTYFKYTGMTLDTMREQMRPQAESFVKTRLALEKIAELENITASEEEIEAEYTRLAEAYQMDADAVKGMIPAESVAEDLKVKAAMELVKTNAVAPVAAE